MKEVLPCTLNLSAAAAGVTTICEQRFTQPNGTSQFSNNTTEEELLSNLTTEEDEQHVDEISFEDSKDISEANYPDLLCTLRKALLDSSFSEQNNCLISLQ